VILLPTPILLFCQSPWFSFLGHVELTLRVSSSLANSNPSILVQPIAIIAIEQNYDCSKTITQQQSSQTPSTGYTVLFANPLNNSDVRSFSFYVRFLLVLSDFLGTGLRHVPIIRNQGPRFVLPCDVRQPVRYWH